MTYYKKCMMEVFSPAVSPIPLCAHSILSSAECKLPLDFTRELEMDSKLSKPPERANQNTELLVSPFHLLAPNSSLIVSSAQWKPSRSKCKRLKKVLSQPVPSKVSTK